METFLPITYLNDFVFCPYSIYLHQVFDNSSEVLYSASPQQTGKSAHTIIDTEKQKEKAQIIKGAYVISNRLGIYGKIDTFYVAKQKLVESKFQIKTLYKGYYYQLWAQYFALTEMGYVVSELCFYSIRDKKTFPVSIPGQKELEELRNHIRKIARFDFEQEMNVNSAKCQHCIYASLCDKTNIDHVYA
jgi:CRISPR-associated protein Cas4